jgi:hypothetical protein
LRIDPKLCIACFIVSLLVVGCGDDDGDDVPVLNQAPVSSINSPIEGGTFKAGDSVNFGGSGTDLEDGPLTAAQLNWWVELHHDAHTHPFQPETVGNNGSVTIPTRGETSDNIFYRFHLRATDSGGLTNEVTRDILPQKSQLTLTTLPAGLAMTLDGQPITGPHIVTGVVGIERDLGAADQNFNGRKYSFVGWSDGGAALHTITTPTINTNYIASFNDIGPVVNSAPIVMLIGTPATGTTGTSITLAVTATDTDDFVAKVEFFDGATKLGEDNTSPYTLAWTPTTTGLHSLTARATDNYGLSATSAAVVVTVSASPVDTQAPVTTVTMPAAFAAGLSGTLTLSASATDNVGVTEIEIQLDGVQIGINGVTGLHSVMIDSNAYASGQHVVRARARWGWQSLVLGQCDSSIWWQPGGTCRIHPRRVVGHRFEQHHSFCAGTG